MTTYSPWVELAGLPSVTLVWQPLRGKRLGEYVRDLHLIRLDPEMRRHQARSVLAHELRHHAHRDLGPCSDWQEARADREAARLLIDVHRLAEAAVTQEQHWPEVARELRVTKHLLEVRLRHLHPSERHYLRDRLEHL